MNKKPLSMTSTESNELALLAKDKGFITMVNDNHRIFPICQKAGERITAVDLGTPYLTYEVYFQD